ncbi:MAG: adenosylcobinamide-phosphate synthase CbiB, partial [Alphaproteobacteria bacterium]
ELSTSMALFLALILDRILGDPPQIWSRVPHPAALVGRVIGWADRRFNEPGASEAARKQRGLILIGGLTIGALGLGRLIDGVLDGLALGFIGNIVLVAILLAHRSLTDHVGAVATALRQSDSGDLEAARTALARIVGRDVAGFDGPKIVRAAIESLAENFADGVVAPAFWYALLGLPGILAYKAINTADSMIGYRTERHRAFGYGAAWVDDLVNYLPGRLSAWLLRIAARLTRGARATHGQVTADARQHASPNAGWPEAAMAHGLGIALGGPRTYEGKDMDGAWLNEAGERQPNADTIDAALSLANTAWVLLLVLAVLFAGAMALVR